jgi:hypothetical protein
MGTSRYSVPFLPCYMPLFLGKHCICRTSKTIEDITAGDYLYERLVDLGLIKK